MAVCRMVVCRMAMCRMAVCRMAANVSVEDGSDPVGTAYQMAAQSTRSCAKKKAASQKPRPGATPSPGPGAPGSDCAAAASV
jgi:hypothetical protein